MTLSARGPIDAPVLSGAGRVHASRARVRFIGAELTDLELEAAVDARGLSITRASARVGDGTAILSGRMPTTGEDAGIVDLGVAARAVNVTIANGIDGTLDAAAQLRVNGPALLRGAPHSVRIAGDVSVAQLVYRRPIDIGVDLATLASWVGRARRHAAPEAYDPARDLVDLAIRVHARAPFEVKNNVVDARFAPEAAVPSPRTPAGDRITRSADLWLRGTTQRPVLFGRLRALPGGRLRLRGISLNIASATVDFDDASHIAPRVDLVATAEVRRISEFESPFDYASPSQTWRLRVAFAESEDDFRVTLSSEPPLGQDDISLLLTIGLTRAELDTMQAAGGSVQASAGLEAIATLGGAERVVRDFLPIDEFRFGSDYSPRTLRLVPDVSLRKHIGERLSASVTTALTEDRDYRGTLSLQVARGWWIEPYGRRGARPRAPRGPLGRRNALATRLSLRHVTRRRRGRHDRSVARHRADRNELARDVKE